MRFASSVCKKLLREKEISVSKIKKTSLRVQACVVNKLRQIKESLESKFFCLRLGFVPAFFSGVGAKNYAESTTKATISEGEIEIRDKDNQKQDLSGLNRDTQNSLNKLAEIFDKTKVEERQELAGLFGEIAYKAVGDLAIKNGWQEGSAEKNALHALVGGIMSELTNSGFLAGASGAMINEMIQDKLSDMFKDNSAMHQWASALIGGVVAQVAADNAQMGAATASSGTKNNYLTHEQQKKYEEELAAIDKDDTLTPEQKDKAKEKVDFKYSVISVLQNREWYKK